MDAAPSMDWIGLSDDFDELPMMKQGRSYFGREPKVRLGTLAAIEKGVLLSGLPGPMLTCDGRQHEELEQIQRDDLKSVAPIFLVYHESRRNDLTLQAVRNWVENCFDGPQKCPCGLCET